VGVARVGGQCDNSQMTTPSFVPRRAFIVAVGSELLTPFRTDTNSLYLTSRLNDLGIEVVGKAVAGDRRHELAQVIAEALTRTDLLVLTGGLGPTEDDVTRLAAADALGLPLDEDPAIVDSIRKRFARRNMRMPDVNRVQAQVLGGAAVLANPNGTAPGQWVDQGGKVVVLLPGPPREMRPMIDAALAERIEPLTGGARLYRRVLKIAGRTESDVETVAQPVYSTFVTWEPPVSTSILAAPGQIELHFSVRTTGAEQGADVLDRATREMLDVVGPDVYSTDGRSLEHVVGDLLRDKGWRIATAESCTGGLVASRLTDVAGSSDYVDRGVVCYSNEAKVELLGVAPALIVQHGAVSEPVASAMAEGMRQRANVQVAIGITGIAGPGGGSEDKPVGTVVVAVAFASGTVVRRFLFPGGREQVKFQASQAALNLARQLLAGS
jgi:nicotinamide-nucleotide amidase